MGAVGPPCSCSTHIHCRTTKGGCHPRTSLTGDPLLRSSYLLRPLKASSAASVCGESKDESWAFAGWQSLSSPTRACTGEHTYLQSTAKSLGLAIEKKEQFERDLAEARRRQLEQQVEGAAAVAQSPDSLGSDRIQ